MLSNNTFVASLLPEDAPLSTIRVVTGAPPRSSTADAKPQSLACVFRAGRAGASTDHDAILFDVDMESGVIREGTVNKEWYQLGVWRAMTSRNAEQKSTYTKHPDCDVAVTGKTVPNIRMLLGMVEDAHLQMCPGVPLCGWDIALTTDGNFLLEVNLSCNFFQAAVNFDNYFAFVAKHFRA